jgi:microcystin degradation protein MlrC
MRVFFAGLYHETHCFVPERTGLADFRIDRGDEILARRGDASQIDGFLEGAARFGWEIVPAAAYTAAPSGLVEDAAFEGFWADVERAARQAAAARLDGVYLALHGAMITETIEDVEGECLRRLRAVDGFAGLPVFGVFDLHANFSTAMAQHANGLVCYHKNPHVDARESAVRAAALLQQAFTAGRTPRMVRRSPGILWPPGGTGTADTPMRDLEQLARALEQSHPDIWAINVVGGFAYADAADAGVSFSAVTVGDEREAVAALDQLCALALALKERGLVSEPDPDTVLSSILPVRRGPVVVTEPSDNIGGGAPGDCTGLLRALVRHRVEGSAAIINDPQAVAALADAAPGQTRRLAIGGKGSPLDEGPLALDLELVSKSDGRFDAEDPNSHFAAAYGRHIEMGPCAVVRHGGTTVLLTSRKTPPNDLGQWRSQGIEPTALSVIGVKAAVAHRRAYDPIAAASHAVRTPGPCTSDPTTLPYRRLRRPIFPLDRSET